MELISKAYAFSSWEALVHVELDLPFAFTRVPLEYSAVYIVHPGAGEVLRIDNWEQVASLPRVYRKRLKIRPGMQVSERRGVGEDAGYLMLSGSDPDELMTDIEQIREKLAIVMT